MIECDSCLTGGSAFSEGCCYAKAYSPDFTHAYPLIYELEALNLDSTMRTLRLDVSSGLSTIVNMVNTAPTQALEMGETTNATRVHP